MLVPIDNFISRATERFITGGAMVGDEATPYLAMVMSICRATLTTHAQNLPDQEQHGACKLLESLLHNCHGRIDAQVTLNLTLTLTLTLILTLTLSLSLTLTLTLTLSLTPGGGRRS